MATLNISFFGSVDKYCAGDAMKSVQLSTSASSANTDVPAGAVVVSMFSDAAHCVMIGTGTPVAAIGVGSSLIPANGEAWRRIQTSNRAALKLAAITI